MFLYQCYKRDITEDGGKDILVCLCDTNLCNDVLEDSAVVSMVSTTTTTPLVVTDNIRKKLPTRCVFKSTKSPPTKLLPCQ